MTRAIKIKIELDRIEWPTAGTLTLTLTMPHENDVLRNRNSWKYARVLCTGCAKFLHENTGPFEYHFE